MSSRKKSDKAMETDPRNQFIHQYIGKFEGSINPADIHYHQGIALANYGSNAIQLLCTQYDDENKPDGFVRIVLTSNKVSAVTSYTLSEEKDEHGVHKAAMHFNVRPITDEGAMLQFTTDPVLHSALPYFVKQNCVFFEKKYAEELRLARAYIAAHPDAFPGATWAREAAASDIPGTQIASSTTPIPALSPASVAALGS